jgi:hypothetical protein
VRCGRPADRSAESLKVRLVKALGRMHLAEDSTQRLGVGIANIHDAHRHVHGGGLDHAGQPLHALVREQMLRNDLCLTFALRGTARRGTQAQRPRAKRTPLCRSAFSGTEWGEQGQACASRALSSASYGRSANASLALSLVPSPPTLANPGSSTNQASSTVVVADEPKGDNSITSGIGGDAAG